MAQIFISHSAKDAKQLAFLNRAFATTNVQAKHEEIEALISGKRTSQQIAMDIQASNAIFVMLGPNVEQLKHTRDWVVSESSNAAGKNKDVWVLEAFEDSPHVSVVIPHVRHYVCFHYDDPWLVYLRQIVASYDDSHILPAGLAGAGVGAVLGGEAGGVGAIIGGLAGLILASNARTKPLGVPLTCLNCRSVYNVHVSVNWLRCPVCNARIQFALTKAQGA